MSQRSVCEPGEGWEGGGRVGGGEPGGMEGVWRVWRGYGGGPRPGYDHQTDRGEERTCPNGLCVSQGRVRRVGGGGPGGMRGMEGVWRGWRGYGGGMEGVWRGYGGGMEGVCRGWEEYWGIILI